MKITGTFHAILLVICAMLVGCDTTRPGVTQKFTGEYTRYYPATGADVYNATQRVFGKLELMPVSDTFAGTKGKLSARNFQNTQVVVRIEEQAQSTFVALLVTPGENEAFSIRLLQMINDELKR